MSTRVACSTALRKRHPRCEDHFTEDPKDPYRQLRLHSVRFSGLRVLGDTKSSCISPKKYFQPILAPEKDLLRKDRHRQLITGEA